MKATRLLGGALLAALLLSTGALAYLFNAWKLKKINRRGPQQEVVVATLPVSLEQAVGAVREAFGDNDTVAAAVTRRCTREEKFLCGLSLHPVSDPLFPDDFQLTASAERANDAALKRYAVLPEAARQHDFLLYNDFDSYWQSEYFWNGQPAEFRSHFILHLAPQREAAATVEVLEYLPTLWVGKRFMFGAHAPLPGFYYDIRFVEPTTRDRKMVLEAIKESLQPKVGVLE